MKILKQIKPEQILFLDIETAPQYPDYDRVPDNFKELWDHKSRFLIKDEEGKRTSAEVYRQAGIYAEFGKVISISAGFFSGDRFVQKAFYGDDERQILLDFGRLLAKSFYSESHYLLAHNGKEFDFPFLSRRYLINSLELPALLDNAGKKPWEIRHLDTMELWKFGDFKSYTSLNLLAEVFNIPSPKGDMDGSMMYKVYWEDKDWDRIVRYNHRDVITLAQLYRKFRGETVLEDSQVDLVSA